MYASRWIDRVLVLWTLALVPAVSAAQAPPLTSIEFSTDAAVTLGGVALAPGDIATDDLAGTVAITGLPRLPGLPPLPPGTNVDAFDRLPNGDVLYSLSGSGAVTRLDRFGRVIGSFSTDYTPGLGLGIDVDAVTQGWNNCGDLLISLDGAGAFPGGPAFDDEDLVGIDSVTFAPYLAFDGSAAGVPDALDLDAADIAPTGELWLSFSLGSGASP